ncbi:MAG: response regulator, partial [Deltaproteobacteria bacterium]|nr:response regulator [Deltaproteobacteria bacterium]
MDRLENEIKILLVDDEDDIRDVLNISLLDMGYSVHQAKNGNEALKLYKEITPDIVLADIKMPGIDGIELLKNIKQDDPDADVIMITGHGDMDLAIKSLKYEAVDFITKPINIDALEISLKRVNEKILMRQKLKEYTEHLEELVREKIVLQDHLSSLGLMLVSISHDIKGVLTNMDGGIYLLNSGLTKKDNEKILEGFEAVRTISTRIKKIVMDVLF